MSSSFGKLLKVNIFGQSHSEAIGVVIDGLPAGIRLDNEEILRFMQRRAPGAKNTTARKEADIPRLLSGLVDSVTCGAPLCAVIENADARSRDYAKLKENPRPMHADFPAFVKYAGANDIRGGGQFSGRLTAPLCFAGAVAMQLLAQKGIYIGSHIASIENEGDALFDPAAVCKSDFEEVLSKDFPAIDSGAGVRMRAAVERAAAEGDSVGGVIECAAVGVPAGLGEPIYDGLENRLAAVLFGIPAVKGVEFGAGFESTKMRGSVHNDPYILDNGEIKTKTNNHGGILGGISTGMPLLLKAAFKPTPSISLSQQTVNLNSREQSELVITGRHDPCVVLRALPCVEAAVALVITDMILETRGNAKWI